MTLLMYVHSLTDSLTAVVELQFLRKQKQNSCSTIRGGFLERVIFYMTLRMIHVDLFDATIYKYAFIITKL